MEIFVASTSKHKLEAVNNVANTLFPESKPKIEGRKTASEINEQPVGHEETVRGALNRLENLKKVIGETRYDILVALENGIFPIKIREREAWFDLACVVVEDAEGNQSFAHSTGVEFDAQTVEEARKKGFETTTVGSLIAERTGADSTDPHSYLTNQIVSRREMLEQALKTAMGQLARTTIKKD